MLYYPVEETLPSRCETHVAAFMSAAGNADMATSYLGTCRRACRKAQVADFWDIYFLKEFVLGARTVAAELLPSVLQLLSCPCLPTADETGSMINLALLDAMRPGLAAVIALSHQLLLRRVMKLV